MFFIVSKVFLFVFTPANFTALVVIVGAVLLLSGRLRAAKGFAGSGAALLALELCLPIGQMFAGPLEDAYPRPALPARVDGILFLGADMGFSAAAERNAPGFSFSHARLITSAALARRYPQAKLVYSGRSESSGAESVGPAGAEIIYADLGLGRGRVIYENRARNTWENFVYTKKLMRPRPGENWVVVTSASHMPRAMAIAARLGWKVIPWSSDYVSPGRGFTASLSTNLFTLDMMFREWIGLIAYRLTGRAA